MSAPTLPALVPVDESAVDLAGVAELAAAGTMLPEQPGRDSVAQVGPSALELALRRVAAIVEALAPHELQDLATGRARLEYRAPEPERSHRTQRREPARRALGIDINAVVTTINGFATPVEVEAYLDGLDSRFTIPVLKQIARAIGPTVATTGRTKAQVQRDIVEGTAGFRTRTDAMSGGAWK